MLGSDKISMSLNDFYVSLPSSASMDIHPSNTLANYTTELHTPIDIDRSAYEVGLCEFQLHGNVYNILEPKEVFRIARESDEIFKLTQSKMLPHTEKYHYISIISIKPGYYRDIDDIIDSLNAQFLSDVYTRDLYITRINETYDNKKDMKISLVSNQGLNINSYDATYVLVEAEVSNIIKDVERVNEKSYEKHYTVNFEKLFENPGPCYVYCNIIEHQRVGDVQAKLLRSVYLTYKSNSECIIYNTPHYLNISINEISTITIDIRTVNGEKFPFDAGSLSVKLHFRIKSLT